MNSKDLSLASALAEAARAINAPSSVDQALQAIVHAAQVSLPGFDQVGISITHRDGRIETLAATGDLVWELDTVQYSLEEGPCVTAIREQPVVVAEHIRTDSRWPRYVPAAVEAGLRAQMAVQLYTNDETLGGLNLYSTVSETIDPEAHVAAELFATHAALALGHVRKESQLAEALTSRMIIGRATGILMERYEIDAERAFQFLIRASTTSNIKLRVVAEELVDQATRRRTTEAREA